MPTDQPWDPSLLRRADSGDDDVIAYANTRLFDASLPNISRACDGAAWRIQQPLL